MAFTWASTLSLWSLIIELYWFICLSKTMFYFSTVWNLKSADSYA